MLSLNGSVRSLTLLHSLTLCLSLKSLGLKMERKQGFFSALKEEVVRGLSPGRSRPKSPARSASPMSSVMRRRRGRSSHHKRVAHPEPFIMRSGSLRPGEAALSPLKEGPDPDGTDGGDSRMEGRWAHWMRAPSVSGSACKRSDLRLLLGVLGAPLAPVHVSAAEPLPHLSIKDTPIVSIVPTYFLSLFNIIFYFLFIVKMMSLINFTRNPKLQSIFVLMHVGFSSFKIKISSLFLPFLMI